MFTPNEYYICTKGVKEADAFIISALNFDDASGFFIENRTYMAASTDLLMDEQGNAIKIDKDSPYLFEQVTTSLNEIINKLKGINKGRTSIILRPFMTLDGLIFYACTSTVYGRKSFATASAISREPMCAVLDSYKFARKSLLKKMFTNGIETVSFL